MFLCFAYNFRLIYLQFLAGIYFVSQNKVITYYGSSLTLYAYVVLGTKMTHSKSKHLKSGAQFYIRQFQQVHCFVYKGSYYKRIKKYKSDLKITRYKFII